MGEPGRRLANERRVAKMKRGIGESGVFLSAMAGVVAALLVLAGGCALFNRLPEAKILADALSGESPLVVNFDASGSTDEDGTIESYLWDFGDQSDASTEILTHHTYLVTDVTTTFTVTLTVTDNLGGKDEAIQTIEVQPGEGGSGGEGAPVASFTVDHLIGGTSLTVHFDATESEAGTGSILEYDWDFGDGDEGLGATVAHTYSPDETAEFLVTLFVWNTEGDVDTAQTRIVVIVPDDTPDQEAPTAELEVDDPVLLYNPYPVSATPSNPALFEVTFDPRGSVADAGHSLEYFVWDFGDGSEWVVETSDLEQTHVFRLPAQAKTYVVRLFVYDDQGLEDIAPYNLTLTQPQEEDEED